ncbi:TIGR00730 family Rossman fold protein [Parasphingorhabdus sp.]|uniref:LOG family protein n=1 Tax=Parasphingorhabdus sp. TaxID=2709688 RepID=UPI003A8F965A
MTDKLENDFSSRRARVQALVKSEAYRPATDDPAFLNLDDLRSARLQLEFLKPDLVMKKEGVNSTVVVFGSARIASTGSRETSRYYEDAREFAAIVSRRFQQEGRSDFLVVTGGGPGIMEAANRGADDVGARSIGLNINLPKEQKPNPYITPELCFQFRYFGLRKMHFLMRAKVLVAFPGGFGTLDEVLEVLTLVQTRKIPPIPIILFGREYWTQAINFEFLVDEGYIDRDDLGLFQIVDSAREAVHLICEFYNEIPPE